MKKEIEEIKCIKKSDNTKENYIKLDSFLKFCGSAITGAEAKNQILSESIKVNNEICTMRGKKLYDNYEIETQEKIYRVKFI